MRPEYNGVKFYGRNDMSIGWQLKEAEPIISGFSADKEYDSINEIIELYNIQELMNLEVRLTEWSIETYEELKSIVKPFTGVVAKFFSSMCNDNFMDYIQNVAIGYIDDFWALFDRFKVYQRISQEIFTEYLNLPDTTLYRILEHKDIVKAYDSPLTNVLRVSDQTCRILVSRFLEKNDAKYYIPDSFRPSEFDSIFQKYIDSGNANPNILRLIFDAQSSGECPISDKVRLSARRKFNEFWKNPGKNITTFGYGIRIRFSDQDEPKEYEKEEDGYCLSYDIRWLRENLDYPTVLNNFCYIFEMFDMCWRSTLVSVKSHITALESIFAPSGKKFYQRGNQFDISAMTSSAQMMMYYDFLRTNNVDLEAVFVWFFTEYIKKEFGVDGFFMKSSSATDYVEKCRTIASEMDGILKQFRMYVRDGSIDRELFEMSSEHLIIDGLPSLIENKYAYACSNEIQQEMFLLFSDQSMLTYTEKTKAKYSTLYKMLLSETIVMTDFAKHQEESIKWLIERHSIILEDGIITLNASRVGVLRDLYDHDVICVHYFRKSKTVLDSMINAGDLRIESTLFSIPEKNYLNYELNKAEYSDGLDLRNKYAHSTYPQSEDIQKHDYVELLKIMVLIVTKINEEFCLRENLNKIAEDV